MAGERVAGGNINDHKREYLLSLPTVDVSPSAKSTLSLGINPAVNQLQNFYLIYCAH